MPRRNNFTMDLPPEIFDQLTRAAKRQMCSRAAIARQALLEWFQAHDPGGNSSHHPEPATEPEKKPEELTAIRNIDGAIDVIKTAKKYQHLGGVHITDVGVVTAAPKSDAPEDDALPRGMTFMVTNDPKTETEELEEPASGRREFPPVLVNDQPGVIDITKTNEKYHHLGVVEISDRGIVTIRPPIRRRKQPPPVEAKLLGSQAAPVVAHE